MRGSILPSSLCRDPGRRADESPAKDVRERKDACRVGSVRQTRNDHVFDLTRAMRHLCWDMVARLPELEHIDLEPVAIGFSQSRGRACHGLVASLTPLRFETGARHAMIDGRRYRMAPLLDRSGREKLYILTYFIPRFFDAPLEEKLSTTLHELWHISPHFDGDLRRHEGRYPIHGRSQKAYDHQMDQMAQRWLALDPPLAVYDFLQWSFQELVAEYGSVVGTRISTPRLIPDDAV